ncbi:MAG TPA: tetratricopeptide repeat protein [Puia sp.]
MQVILSFLKRAFLLLFFLFEYFWITAQTPATNKGGIMTSVKSADSIGDVYAIITGISNYPGINPLRYADKDAILFREFLKTPNGGSVKSENILSLINDSAKAADFNVRAYSWLQRKNLKKNDRLYIYFSGHGDAMNDDLYFLLPYDCEPNKDDHNYLGTGNINMHTVKSLFIKPQVQKGVNVIMIIDACRTNELPGGTAGQQSFANNLIEEQKMGEIMFLSTGAGQVSIESPAIGNGHGLFTYYLIDGLAGAADKDSSNGDNDGKVSLAEISAYVKTQVSRKARIDFKTTQIPYYCCAEKDLSTISNVDPSTYTAWENSKKAQQMSADQNLFAFNTPTQGHKGVMRTSDVDTSQIRIYNELIKAMNKENLVGDSSAETFYNILEKNWPGSVVTEDAKFSLAAKYINFCQQKINLFLSGKGLVHIIYMEKEINKEKNENSNAVVTETGEEIKKLKTLVTTGFDVAETMMEKAVEMLKNEPELMNPILPKLDFLKTMSAYGDKNSKLNDVLQYCRKAIASDSTSACGYQLMGWIYQDMQNDSCAYYFNKAAAIAPKWAYPMNGLGNFYIARNNKKEATKFFLKAVELDSLFANAYRNIGMNYYNQKIYDSAKYYFLKALKINPRDSYANENMGSANEDYISPQFGSTYTDSVFFKISRRFFLKSIECDSGFASGYQKLSALYSIAKNEDSALSILQSCVSINSKNAEAYRNLGTYLLNKRKDTLQAETYYRKAIGLDPSSGDNYYSLARLYRKQNNKDKAIGVLMEALDKIGNNKDLFNEIGNAYFEAPTNFEKAISFYNMALKTDSTSAYINFNLGKLYAIKDAAKDSSIYYYSKAVFYDPDRFYKINHTIADFYYDNKNFSMAKSFYEQALRTPTFTKNRDLERLITILVNESNVAEAENVLKKYLDPASDNELYTKLSKTISEAPAKK